MKKRLAAAAALVATGAAVVVASGKHQPHAPHGRYPIQAGSCSVRLPDGGVYRAVSATDLMDCMTVPK